MKTDYTIKKNYHYSFRVSNPSYPLPNAHKKTGEEPNAHGNGGLNFEPNVHRNKRKKKKDTWFVCESCDGVVQPGATNWCSGATVQVVRQHGLVRGLRDCDYVVSSATTARVVICLQERWTTSMMAWWFDDAGEGR